MEAVQPSLPVSPGAPPSPGSPGSPGAPQPPSPSTPPAGPPLPVPPGATDCEPAEGDPTGLQLTEIASGLNQPTFVTTAPGDDSRLFVLERSGAIRVIRDGVLLPEPFLDLSARVATSNEEGLIGLAFHPSYQDNGRFFVQYALADASRAPADDQQVVLSEFARSDGDERADAGSERQLMLVEQPADIHLGGMLAFGPADGMLYISRGDGGTTDSQELSSWLGKMLRIDVDGESDGRPYGIPEGNMSGDGVLPEIWNLGWRNPWRFSFDACTADLYVGDVGESNFEEVNFEPANSPGRNYGWKTLEGPRCFDATVPCDPSAFTAPALVYERDFGCAITSGYVYRGHRIPSLRGTFLYADYCFGNFGSLRIENGQAVDIQDITLDINAADIKAITSFGADNSGELYVVSQVGSVFRVDPR